LYNYFPSPRRKALNANTFTTYISKEDVNGNNERDCSRVNPDISYCLTYVAFSSFEVYQIYFHSSKCYSMEVVVELEVFS